MTNAHTDASPSRKPLRLWPGVAAGAVILFMFAAPTFLPEVGMFGVIGVVFAALAVLLWWVFFSRTAWSERLGVLALMIVALFATSRVVHESIATGMMGMMPVIFGIPVLSLALVAGAVLGRRLSDGRRRASIVAAILVGCALLALLRTGGIKGDGTSDLSWRWTPSPEEQLLSQANDEPTVAPPAAASVETPTKQPPPQTSPGAAPAESGGATTSTAPDRVLERAGDEASTLPLPATAVIKSAEWPGFRGSDRNGIVRGVRIDTDWSQAPPVQVWRRAIGPGWSSFAVRGDLFYTQEQRGDDEIVAAYKVATGEPVWRHRDPVRFWESNGGAGPRGTPTIYNGRVYTFGATGILNALDAGSGAVAWSRNVASETDSEVPMWGFASSPLVVDDLVVVSAAGTLAAYELTSGQRRWVGPKHAGSYSSPQRANLDGVTQILILDGAGATSVAPATGAVLWEHPWPGGAIVQPALTGDGDVLINTIGGTGGNGTRRLAATHGSGKWIVEERWTSNGLKPYFNDLVVHNGHAYGFDGSILACIDLADGKRKWKGGRYGNGQMLLLPDQDVLLVLSEEGELALVGATPDQFKELARFPALEGKTWNHPVLVGDILLIRNGEEMAAFRLSLAAR